MRVWILVFGIATATNVLADPVDFRERTEYYDVRGTTAEELTRQMARLGPPQPSGRRAWALTAWQIESKYTLVPGKSDCRLVEPRVTLDVLTTIPRWTDSGTGPGKLRVAWRKMLVAIVEHEQVHRTHAVGAAERTAELLARLAPHADCARMERQARIVLKREMASARKLSRAFDQETDFGALEGVSLDP